MGRHVGRSRGCQKCRQRRIKCDEKIPECSQCLHSGKPCPGPLQGTLFIDTVNGGHDNSKTVRDNKPVISKKHSVTTSPHSHSSFQPQSSSRSNEERPAISDVIIDRSPTTIQIHNNQPLMKDPGGYRRVQLPSLYQPSKGDESQSTFLRQFIAAFFNPKANPTRPNTWVYELPSVLSAAPSSALICSIRAATMAHYGKRNGDVAMQLEACHWYDRGLESQRLESHDTELQLAKGESAADIISEATISAPILFSLFESLMTTSFAAWAQHITAAGKMLELRGPAKCQDGTIHHLFRSVRLGSIYIGIAFERPSVFASEEWCRVPYEHHDKTSYDKLADILLQVPGLFILRNHMRSRRERNDAAYEAARWIVEVKAQSLISWLARYWEQCADTISFRYDYSRFTELCDFQTDAQQWIVEETRPAYFEDAFTATNVALYDAAIIIANSLAWEATSGDPEVNKQRIVTHCASILSIVAYHESRGTGSGGSVSMVFPMKVVCQATPSDHQRQQAEAALLRWGESRGVAGICKSRATLEGHGIYRGMRRSNETGVGDSKTASQLDDPSRDVTSSVGARQVPPPQVWAGTLLHEHRVRI